VGGTGTFMPNEQAQPIIGSTNQQERVDETRVEVIFPSYLEHRMVQTLKRAHPYEEAAYYLTPLTNENQEVGSGMVGALETPMEPMAFLKLLKERMNLPLVRHTAIFDRIVKNVAVCGGSGSFLLPRPFTVAPRCLLRPISSTTNFLMPTTAYYSRYRALRK
jgi:putative NIF3 family GTP cyclohydrolase 1 type 2